MPSTDFSYYGEPGATLQSVTVFFGPERIWLYDSFALDDAYEGRESVTGMFRLRGGWNLSTNIAQLLHIRPTSVRRAVRRGPGRPPAVPAAG